jgi:ribose transport system substrate-binding protein
MKNPIKSLMTCIALLSALLSALFGALFAATAHAQTGPAGKRIALLVGPTQDKYIGAWTKTFIDAAAAKGMKVNVFSSPYDPAMQAQQIDDAIAQKFDALLVQTISQKAVIPPLMRAKAAKVPAFTIISEFPGNEAADLYISYLGTNSTWLGALAGDAMGKALTARGKPNAKIAVIAGSMAEGIAPMRMNGFRRALAKYPGIEIASLEDVKWNPAVAERTAGQLLARFAGQGGLDGIYGMNDSLANGAIQAASAAGVKLGTEPGALTIVGGNCQAPGIRNIEAGRMAATVLMVPAEEAKLAAQKVQEFFDGKALEKKIFIEHEIITKANVGKFADACSY